MKLIIILLSLLVLGLPVGYFKLYYKKPVAGTVVILYGTSSSGKTSIINELKKIYGNTYQVVNIDSFLSTHNPPEEKEIKSESPEEKDLRMSRIFFDMFYGFVREQALKGQNVLVDTVPFTDLRETADVV